MIKSVIGMALDCLDADALADFYAELTGWEKTISGGGWAGIHTPQGLIMAFQTVEAYVPPVWPWQKDKQQQMAHMDLLVDDLADSVAHALRCGATKADEQYFTTSTVMFDPAGHPFCLSSVGQ